MPAPDASNAKLRELLNFSDGGAGDELRRNAVAKITLAAFLGADRRHTDRAEMSRTLLDIIEDESASGAQMSRTLLDIIRDESTGGAAVYGAHLAPNHPTRNGWKSFKYRLGLRRGGASSWTGGPVRIPAPGVPISHSSRTNTALPIQNHPGAVVAAPAPAPAPAALTRPGQIALNSDVSTRNESSPQRGVPESPCGRGDGRLGDVLAAERERLSEAGEVGAVEEADGEPSARMSLMALLEETDRQMGIEGPAAYSEYDEYEVEDGGGSVVGGMDSGHSADHNCCVCMVRHKGAAFIPCGHTFCRLCSRELWVNRGNCPVCNSYILEILDIF